VAGDGVLGLRGARWRRLRDDVHVGSRCCVAALTAIIGVLTPACGDGIEGSAGQPVATTAAAVTTSVGSVATTTAAVPVDALPGEPFEIAPPEGTILSVLGVRHDDVLNVRHVPGLDGEVVDTLAPTSDDSVATGRSRQLPNSIWWEVITSRGARGWVSARYTGVTGVTTDVTAEVLADLGRPSATTVADVGRLVAESRSEGEPTWAIEMVVPPSYGDLAQVTFDVAGLGDDAASGRRLLVFAHDEEGDDIWTLHTVESTVMCQSYRGGTPGEPCP